MEQWVLWKDVNTLTWYSTSNVLNWISPHFFHTFHNLWIIIIRSRNKKKVSFSKSKIANGIMDFLIRHTLTFPPKIYSFPYLPKFLTNLYMWTHETLLYWKKMGTCKAIIGLKWMYLFIIDSGWGPIHLLFSMYLFVYFS